MSKNRRFLKVPIHVTIPINILESIDAVTNNRSKFIVSAVTDKLHSDISTITDSTTRQLMAALTARDDCDPTLARLLRIMLAD